MNPVVKSINEKKILKTVHALNKNNYDARYFESREDLIKALDEMIEKGASTTLGGSQTLAECGVQDFVKSDKFNFIDRKKPGSTEEELHQLLKDASFADYYFMSSNAVTEDGGLYNVDGIGNRVAALIHGPKNVVVVVTPNKIVKDVDAAIERNKSIAAPMNCERLSLDNPCTKTGRCMDCKKESRICIYYTFMKYQRNKNRIKVFFLNEDLGY